MNAVAREQVAIAIGHAPPWPVPGGLAPSLLPETLDATSSMAQTIAHLA
jgi:hypothetical protein